MKTRDEGAEGDCQRPRRPGQRSDNSSIGGQGTQGMNRRSSQSVKIGKESDRNASLFSVKFRRC